jgi:hypothetical protein
MEQLRLVRKMPVDRATRHPCGRRDVLEARARDSTPREFTPCRTENLTAYPLRFLLRSTQCVLRFTASLHTSAIV